MLILIHLLRTSDDTANHGSGSHILRRLTRALFHTHFRIHVRYHGLRCTGYNTILLTVLVLRPRDEFRRVFPRPTLVSLTLSYSWTLISDVIGSHAENL